MDQFERLPTLPPRCRTLVARRFLYLPALTPHRGTDPGLREHAGSLSDEVRMLLFQSRQGIGPKAMALSSYALDNQIFCDYLRKIYES